MKFEKVKMLNYVKQVMGTYNLDLGYNVINSPNQNEYMKRFSIDNAISFNVF